MEKLQISGCVTLSFKCFRTQISLCLDAVDRRRLNYVFQVSGNYEWEKVLGLYNRSTAFRNEQSNKKCQSSIIPGGGGG